MDEVARKLRRLADAAAAPYCTYRPYRTLRKRLLKMNLEQLIAELGTEDDDEQLIAELGTEDDDEHSEGTRDEEVDEEDAGEEDEDADEDADEEDDHQLNADVVDRTMRTMQDAHRGAARCQDQDDDRKEGTEAPRRHKGALCNQCRGEEDAGGGKKRKLKDAGRSSRSSTATRAGCGLSTRRRSRP